MNITKSGNNDKDRLIEILKKYSNIPDIKYTSENVFDNYIYNNINPNNFASRFVIPIYKRLKNPQNLCKIKKKNIKIQYIFEFIESNIEKTNYAINIGKNKFYYHNDLFERIYNCPNDCMVAISSRESKLLGTLLVDYLAIEEEFKKNKVEYEKTLSEFISKYDNESKLFTEERLKLIKEYN